MSDASTFVEPAPTALALLLLGQDSDALSERGVECPGALPMPSDPDLVARASAANAALVDRVFVPGHHYQRYEAIQGSIYFRAKSLMANPLGFRDRLIKEFYTEPVLPPEAPRAP